ncbi:MAG: YfiR family protein [Archangiaceae bacterium]|nr:YfiR family protein [Archangiaceae bacterium]
MPRRLASVVIAAGLVLAGEARAADALPAKNQAVLMLRVLLYDKNLKGRAAEGPVKVVVVARADSPKSRETGDEMVKVLSGLATRALVGGRKLEVRLLTEQAAAHLGPREPVTALYLATELENPRELLTVSRQRRALSFSGDAAAIEAGAAVGFVQKDDRIGITVNLKSAQAEGADLDAELLGLADVKR